MAWVVRATAPPPVASIRSEPARWPMGLLGGDDWGGRWFGSPTEVTPEPAPLFRKGFPPARDVTGSSEYVGGPR